MVRPPRQPPSKETERGDVVVERILDCALAEVAESGYGGLSLERVADRAGVAKTTVWRRWPTKAALVQSAFEASVTRVIGDEPDGPLRPTLVVLLKRLGAHLTSDVGRGLFAALASASGSEELGAILDEVRERGEALPRRLIKRAIRRGELPPHVDVALTFDMLIGALKHRIFHVRKPVSDAYLRRLVDATLGGVAALAEDPRAEPPPRRQGVGGVERRGSTRSTPRARPSTP